MPVSKSKKFFFILFLVVTFLWIGYQAVLSPILQKHNAEARFAQAVAECTNYFRPSPDVDKAAEESCMVRAEGMYVIRRTVANRVYSLQGLPELLVRCVSLPLLTYGLSTIFAALRRRRGQGKRASMYDQFA